MIPQTAAPPPGTGGVPREIDCSSGFANSTPLFFRTIRLKARIIFTRHDVIMLWWVLDMTHRQTEEPGWNDHGVSLARWDDLQTD